MLDEVLQSTSPVSVMFANRTLPVLWANTPPGHMNGPAASARLAKHVDSTVRLRHTHKGVRVCCQGKTTARPWGQGQQEYNQDQVRQAAQQQGKLAITKCTCTRTPSRALTSCYIEAASLSYVDLQRDARSWHNLQGR